MPLFYQHNINENTKLGIWKIEEPEAFFVQAVPLKREITHPHKRLQHLAGRYLLKTLFPGFPYEEIMIADTKKPYLPYEQYHFSISHCGGYAAAIVSKSERVGIDIEIPTEKIEKISHKFLNEAERKMFPVSDFPFLINNEKDQNYKPQTTNHKLQLLTVLWGAKETVFKWWGWGSVDFSEHILLQPFALNDAGSFEAEFIRGIETFTLHLHYKLFDGLCLVWLVSIP